MSWFRVTPRQSVAAKITLGFCTRLLEVIVFLLFFLSLDGEPSHGSVVAATTLNALCFAAFSFMTVAFLSK